MNRSQDKVSLQITLPTAYLEAIEARSGKKGGQAIVWLLAQIEQDPLPSFVRELPSCLGAFEQAVLQALARFVREHPHELITYAGLAKLAGAPPTAARAVGQVLRLWADPNLAARVVKRVTAKDEYVMQEKFPGGRDEQAKKLEEAGFLVNRKTGRVDKSVVWTTEEEAVTEDPEGEDTEA